jgi:hypothetical protein
MFRISLRCFPFFCKHEYIKNVMVTNMLISRVQKKRIPLVSFFSLFLFTLFFSYPFEEWDDLWKKKKRNQLHLHDDMTHEIFSQLFDICIFELLYFHHFLVLHDSFLLFLFSFSMRVLWIKQTDDSFIDMTRRPPLGNDVCVFWCISNAPTPSVCHSA